MRKRNLTAEEIKALYPPMSNAFDKTVQSTLYDLEHREGKPVVKKKMSIALIFAVILILITLSAAIALTQSDLLRHMFGSSEQVPQGLAEIVSQPKATVTTADVALTLNEYLYDGEKLYLNWTLSNTTGRQVMISMSNFKINGMDMNEEDWTSFQSEDNTSVYVLGGEVEDIAMPVSINNFCTLTNMQNEESPLIRGETVDITSELYIWELLNPPVLFQYSSLKSYLDYANIAVPHGLPVDWNGAGYLTWFVADGNSSQIYISEDYQRAYEEFGWAKLTKVAPVKFTITLDPKSIKQVQPTQTSFEMEDFKLVITRMAYMQTGGTLELKVYPKNLDKGPRDMSNYARDLVVIDANTMAYLSGGFGCSYSSDQDYLDYQITLDPVSGEMPTALLITTPVVKDKWDPEAVHDPKQNIWYRYPPEDTARVELK